MAPVLNLVAHVFHDADDDQKQHVTDIVTDHKRITSAIEELAQKQQATDRRMQRFKEDTEVRQAKRTDRDDRSPRSPRPSRDAETRKSNNV